MGLKDKIVRKLALRWASGKVKDLRGKNKETGMGKVLKFLDGWKLVIAVVAMFGVSVYDQTQNGHAGDIIGAILTVLGFLPTGEAFSASEIGKAASSALAVWALVHKAIKANRQLRAGATASELLTAEGYAAELLIKK